MPKNEYVSIPELAKLLGVSRITIYNKVKKGEIKANKIGRNYAVPKKYLTDLLGGELDEAHKQGIKRAVKKTVEEYGEVLKKLGKE